MVGKNLIQKLKTGLIGLSMLGASYFNANAQMLTKTALLEPYYNTKLENINYLPKYNTIAHKMLMIEDSGIAGSYPPLKKLDEAIDLSKKFIKKTNYTKQELSELSKKIYLIINAVDYPLAHDNDEGPWFSRLPTCYIYSLYYLAIGQANNLPFYAVDFEKKGKYSFFNSSLGHMFIRYDSDGKHDVLNQSNPINRGDMNIEATTGEIQNGKEHSDNYYISEYDIPEISLKNKDYLVNLDEKKLLGISYTLRASRTILHASGIKEHFIDSLDEEIKDCEKCPKDPLYGYRLLATKEQKEKCLEKKNIEFCKDSINREYAKLINESIKFLDKAIELNSNSFIAYYNKGKCYESLCTKDLDLINSETDKDFVLKSIENYIKAAEISPTPEIYRKIAFYYSYLGKEGCYKDIESITKAINLAKRNIKNEKDLEDKLRELESDKKQIEESAKYRFKWCDKIDNLANTH